MMRVKYEEYWNDSKRRDCEAFFNDLKGFEDWIFGQMKSMQNRPGHNQQGYGYMFFPKEKVATIQFEPEQGKTVWVRMITDDNGDGIYYSDGTFTSGQRHWSQEVKDWLAKCRERYEAPKFHFIP